MADAQEIRRGLTCAFALNVHLVFVTQYRRKVLDARAIEALRPVWGEVCADFGAQLVDLDEEDDHVHLLVNDPPDVSISRLVNIQQQRA
jgi:putative transposase